MQKTDISRIGKKTISTFDLYEAFRLLGIQQGDIICVHSELMGLGKPLLGKRDFMKAVVDTLFEAIGRTGTLIMPTFSYSFCKDDVFDVQNSPSDVGVLTEYFRNMANVKRTWHPIFSFAVSGAKIEDYLDIGPDAFGFDSVYGKMLRDEGKIVMLGANAGYTFYHLAEEHLNVSHRYFKNYSGSIIADGKEYKTCVPYFVRCLDRKSVLNERQLSQFLIETECQKQVKFARGTIAVIDCNEMYHKVCDALRINEMRFL